MSFPNPLFLCSFRLSLKSSELEEDEGFGDWSQKTEQRQQFWENEGTAEGREPSQSESPEEKQAEDRQVKCGPGWAGRWLSLTPAWAWTIPFCLHFPKSPPKCEAGREVERKGDKCQDGQGGGYRDRAMKTLHSRVPQGWGPHPDQLWPTGVGGCHISTQLRPTYVM